MAMDYRTPAEIQEAGFAALIQALGPAGMIRFMLQFESGSGDYTAERHAWLDDVSIEDVVRDVERRLAAEPDA